VSPVRYELGFYIPEEEIGRGAEGSESEAGRDVGQLATKQQSNRKCFSVLCARSSGSEARDTMLLVR
jgi:hypothetical protein